MKAYKLIYVLYKIRLLSPLALFQLTSAIYKYGINLMALLNFSARTYGENVALVDEQETLTYKQLFAQSEGLSVVLRGRYHLARGKKAGFLCKNHASLVRAIFAVSLSGADLYLLNAEMSKGQLNNILERHHFDLLIYDEELSSLLEQTSYTKAKMLSYHDTFPAINNLLSASIYEKQKRHRTSSGKLVLLTGGTTGNAKEAAHKPSLFNYLDPFSGFLTRLKILNYHTAYIATPIYHGYGVAVLLLFCALGKKMVIHRGFDAEKACRLIREHQVDVVTVVPLMLHKMLKSNAEDLKSLSCIASGGAELNPKLAKETLRQLGDVLYNLYGTSEAGLNIIADPQDLIYSAHTIGRKIEGVRLVIVDDLKEEVEIGRVGQFCIKNKWSMRNVAWIETGDLGYRDEKGYYFLCGRADSMIVSAGENVYPLEVEQVLLTHPGVEDAAVIGIRDEHFGQRLKAFVLLAPYNDTTREELFEWLRSRLARFQLPKEIIFVDHLPYTPLGKLDKKLLK
ncbi:MULTISPECIES: AMP-binding protein [unclassified Paenibacillus]|uniref:AMP-binding protein n=1 Tax=unclassified Paenibacillus TaxID=185978 RepID=UPI002784BFC1|nr:MULTISPECIES: AMP-binding protein [unclassified Paenibacillus]MDQ0899012.1 fatty-acyl-CoA synthase [Paenibacillus sp. V4I7]MDQ0915002.1 fatty-acyl-CoA synthase [Paenibacillus sp. V4I5]